MTEDQIRQYVVYHNHHSVRYCMTHIAFCNIFPRTDVTVMISTSMHKTLKLKPLNRIPPSLISLFALFGLSLNKNHQCMASSEKGADKEKQRSKT